MKKITDAKKATGSGAGKKTGMLGAELRANNRKIIVKNEIHTTAFGPVTLRKARGAGGFASTNQKNFKGSTAISKTDGSYLQLVGRASKDTLKLVEYENKRMFSSKKYRIMKKANVSTLSADQKRIAAHLMGIGIAEQQRHPSAHKGFRAALREAEKLPDKSDGGKSKLEAVENAFPQAAPASRRSEKNLAYATGARAFHMLKKTGVALTRAKNARLRSEGYFSDDSDDD
ncbi:hypothetical protein [Undibacterium curvum]|uniref:hypothetical protein n=1 Tax=Undibacterium curvum TaxID=2762294 RepID=UPI003D0E1A2B